MPISLNVCICKEETAHVKGLKPPCPMSLFSWASVRHLKSKDPKKVNILEVNGTQYKDTKSIANRIGDVLAELTFPQKYDHTFPELKQKEKQKTKQVNHTSKEKYNELFSKEELTRAFEAAKNPAPGPDKIHNEILKHLLPEGLDSLFALYNKIWKQGYFPGKWLEFIIIPL